MRGARLLLPVLVAVTMVAGCGGSSTPVAGQTQAAAACKGDGSQAAALANEAATANSKYATLAADEQALATNEASQANVLQDGDSNDDNGLGALTGATALGSTAGDKVLGDCVALGLPTPGL